MAYLGDKFEWKLYPRDARIRARIHQYMHLGFRCGKQLAVDGLDTIVVWAVNLQIATPHLIISLQLVVNNSPAECHT